MPFPAITTCLVCDGVRQEILNKYTIVGFYGVTPVSRQNLVRVENAAIPLVPRIEKRAWTQVSVALRSAKVLFRTWGHPAYIYKDG